MLRSDVQGLGSICEEAVAAASSPSWTKVLTTAAATIETAVLPNTETMGIRIDPSRKSVTLLFETGPGHQSKSMFSSIVG
jgi:hypothetical protein